MPRARPNGRLAGHRVFECERKHREKSVRLSRSFQIAAMLADAAHRMARLKKGVA